MFNLISRKKPFPQLLNSIVKLLLSLLIFVILASFLGGVVKTFLDLTTILNEPLDVTLRKIIVDSLILLAIIEIYRTAFLYFSEGRVKVTYIVDTVLVVMLSELISSWFKNEDLLKIFVLIAVLFSLVIIRILAIRYHPRST